MRTEDLIGRLSEEPAVAPWRPGPLLAAALGAALVVAGFAFLALWGFRPALGAAMSDPETLAKTLLPLALALAAVPTALAAARPGAEARTATRLLLLVPAAAGALLLLALLRPEGERLALFIGHSIHVCLPSIAVLSAPFMAAMMAVLRQGAALAPARAGALAGLASGGLAAALYSTFCTEDSPLFYVPWYGLGIGLATVAGAVIGRRVLRW